MIRLAASDPTLPNDITQRARELGPLESPLIWWTFAGFAVAATAAAIVLWYRRHPRGWSLSVAVVCLLLAAGTAVNSFVGYVRTQDDLARLMERGGGTVAQVGQMLDDGQDEPDNGGTGPGSGTVTHSSALRIETVSLPDPAHDVPSGTNYVILPPGYSDPANAAVRYPVVYLIHGYPFGGPRDWLTAGNAPDTLQALLDDRLIAPMIVVSVDMTAGQPERDWECLNVPGGPQLETYLTSTVVPAVDHRYRTVANRQGRALGGMSGGGFGALNIGLHHLDGFATLVISLPYDDLNDSIGVLDGNLAAIKLNTPRTYIPTMRFTEPVAVMLAIGTGAPTDVATAKRIAASLEKRGQVAVVHAEHGFNHTWHTARATLPYLLAFANQNFHDHPQSPPAG